MRRSIDPTRIPRPLWLAPAVLVMPAIAVSAYGVMRLGGAELPRLEIPWIALPIMTAVFLVGALTEELGWSGYAAERLQLRLGALHTALLIGAVTAIWHVVPLLQVGRDPAWIGWHCINIAAGRVLLVWLYNNAGRSILAPILCHATMNLSWQLFPNRGSHYDPKVVGLVTLAAAVLVVTAWGPRTLTGRAEPAPHSV